MDVKVVTSSIWVSSDRLQGTTGRVTSIILSARGWILEAGGAPHASLRFPRIQVQRTAHCIITTSRWTLLSEGTTYHSHPITTTFIDICCS